VTVRQPRRPLLTGREKPRREQCTRSQAPV